jgi:hypothetical protein
MFPKNMGYRGWVKDTRMCQFGQKEQVIKTNMYYLSKNEALLAARKILVTDKKIFQFVWEFLETNYDNFVDVFPNIFEFKDFDSRIEEGKEPEYEFLDELVDLEHFDEFLKVYPFLSYGIEKI